MSFETPEQLAAGIALTRKSAKEFATEADVAPMTLSRVLNSNELLKNMRADTKERLDRCFSLNDVEFIPGGARLSLQTTVVLSGRKGFAEFRQRVLKEVRAGNADVCIYTIDERDFDKWGEGEVNQYYRSEMAKLRESGQDYSFRTLIKEGDKHLSAAQHSEYRWVEDDLFSEIPYYIFGRNAASMIFTEDSCDIIIIRIPKYINEKRKLFNQLWDKAEPLKFDPMEALPK